MPNHEVNNVVIIGDPEKIKRFVAEALMDFPLQGEDDELGDRPAKIIDFERIIPMPPGLRDTVSPHEIAATQEEADQKNAEYNELPFSKMFDEGGAPKIRYLTIDEVNRRVAEYGAVDWYGWSVEHWGTKWGAYTHTHYELGFFKDYEDGVYGRVDLRFETAWSAPTPIFQKIEETWGVAVYCVTQDEGGFPDVFYPDEDVVKDREILSREVTYEFENWHAPVDVATINPDSVGAGFPEEQVND